ncbi:hypothetical protein [Planctomyces sp. SH-PL62]|uniref:hypothetical protein n=1 Tax=Planctomyces sp. SH-PL62 TaxID=1636152 RepID=UPI0012E81E62|nr:hypothetical protein [Planctomyces sp. SH-PL62]
MQTRDIFIVCAVFWCLSRLRARYLLYFFGRATQGVITATAVSGEPGHSDLVFYEFKDDLDKTYKNWFGVGRTDYQMWKQRVGDPIQVLYVPLYPKINKANYDAKPMTSSRWMIGNVKIVAVSILILLAALYFRP